MLSSNSSKQPMKDHLDLLHLSLIFLNLLCLMLSACSKPIPVSSGNVMTISRTAIPGQGAYTEQRSEDSLLSIHWFGTANYYISLGDVAILTDPFVSYQSLFRILFSGYINSNNELVNSSYGLLKPPNGIFIGHSHYDHMLDTVEALKLPGWESVPVYGSKTTKHILAGYQKDLSVPNTLKRNWSENWRETKTLEWIEVYPVEGGACGGKSDSNPYKICYKAFKAQHAPHLPPDFKYFAGEINKPLEKPPHTADEFKEGQTYIYLFKFIRKKGNEEVSHTVGLVGAATNITEDLEKADGPVDILILCVPGWQYKREYPGKLIEAFHPRVIILSHYDNFFEPDRNKRPIKFVPSARFYEFLGMLQGYADYERFEKVLVPDVGITLHFEGW